MYGVSIPAEEVVLEGELDVPADALGVVAFAHGSGSSRHSPRNRQVASSLREAGLATLLFDLLEPREEAEDMRTRRLRFDVELLGRRLVAAIDWLASHVDTASMRAGCFGASTGAAAALIAAARRPDRVAAVVSRGGRPDLAGSELREVTAPTLLVIGGEDTTVIELNQEAQQHLNCEHRLEIVHGAGHLFEEPGALERVSELARDWFVRWLAER